MQSCTSGLVGEPRGRSAGTLQRGKKMDLLADRRPACAGYEHLSFRRFESPRFSTLGKRRECSSPAWVGAPGGPGCDGGPPGPPGAKESGQGTITSRHAQCP